MSEVDIEQAIDFMDAYVQGCCVEQAKEEVRAHSIRLGVLAEKMDLDKSNALLASELCIVQHALANAMQRLINLERGAVH